MKKVLIQVRKEDFEKIEPILSGRHTSIIHADDTVELKVFIPATELDGLLTELDTLIDWRYKCNLIEVSEPEFVISSTLRRAEQRSEGKERTPIEELMTVAWPYRSLEPGKLLLTTIAGLVAMMGLFMNSVAIIIGAMLLSPILGPIHSFAINVAVGRGGDALRNIGLLAAFLVAVILVCAAATFLIAPFGIITLTPEILTRTEGGAIYIIMTLLLGFASIVAITREISEAIAGIAIAAALIPPAAVAGIVVVLAPSLLTETLLLVLDNVIGLLAGALAATTALQISPRKESERSVARRSRIRASIIMAVLIGLLVGLSLVF